MTTYTLAQQTFVDGVLQHELYPGTFEIPSGREKANLTIGDYVKVGFIGEGRFGEKMWLRVTEFVSEGVMIGILASEPVIFTEYHEGDKFQFYKDHILGIFITVK